MSIQTGRLQDELQRQVFRRIFSCHSVMGAIDYLQDRRNGHRQFRRSDCWRFGHGSQYRNERAERSEARSEASGDYLLLNLKPGGYELEVDAPGFRRYVQKGIKL